MKKYWSLVLVLSVAILPILLLSCSSSGSGGGGGEGAPSLSNFNHPSTVNRGQTYIYSADFSDPEGDIKTVYNTDSWNGGSVTNSVTAAEAGISGTSGTITVVYPISPYAATGTHHVTIWVEDAENHTSNRLEADIQVR